MIHVSCVGWCQGQRRGVLDNGVGMNPICRVPDDGPSLIHDVPDVHIRARTFCCLSGLSFEVSKGNKYSFTVDSEKVSLKKEGREGVFPVWTHH